MNYPKNKITFTIINFECLFIFFLQLPYGVEVSSSCRDIIYRLLQRDPDKRITYEELAKHSFIDLEHIPSSSSLQKAVSHI
jgi:serine/threonine protein kinase